MRRDKAQQTNAKEGARYNDGIYGHPASPTTWYVSVIYTTHVVVILCREMEIWREQGVSAVHVRELALLSSAIDIAQIGEVCVSFQHNNLKPCKRTGATGKEDLTKQDAAKCLFLPTLDGESKRRPNARKNG